MSHRSSIALRFAGLFLALCPLLLFGQDNTQTNQNQKPTVRTPLLVNVTGCLKRSTASGGYYVSDQQGRTWELTSKKVDLAQHVFHTVSVSGHPSSASKTQEGKSEQGQNPDAGNQHFALDVTELDMISPSCTR